MKAVLFVLLQSLVFALQLLTLTTTYWTTWDLRFNWTQTIGRYTAKPSSDGQLVSRGHAGLWSRCIVVYGTGKHINGTKLSVDRCLSNFDDFSGTQRYNYGKICKTATAGLCVTMATTTAILLVITMVTLVKRNRLPILGSLQLLLLIIQGSILTIIPVLYISGNMAELIHQLTTAYGLLLVVNVQAVYYHSWSYWLQVSLPILWMLTIGVYIIKEIESTSKDQIWKSSNSDSSKMKVTAEQADSAETEALQRT